jgi:hypothetical protein
MRGEYVKERLHPAASDQVWPSFTKASLRMVRCTMQEPHASEGVQHKVQWQHHPYLLRKILGLTFAWPRAPGTPAEQGRGLRMKAGDLLLAVACKVVQPRLGSRRLKRRTKTQ